jgi:hypothetical protein
MGKKFFASGMPTVVGRLILLLILAHNLLVKRKLAIALRYFLAGEKVQAHVVRLAIAHLPCAAAVGPRKSV